MAKKRRHKRKSSHRRRRRMSGDPSLSPSVISGTRRKGRKKIRRRRKAKMGFVTGNELGDVLLGFGLGFGSSVAINKLLPETILSRNKRLAAEGLIGGVSMIYGVHKKNPFVTGFGLGMSTSPALGALSDAGLISGMDEFMSGIGLGKEDELLIEMNGVEVNSTNLMSGAANELNPSVISGEEEDGMGDDGGFMGATSDDNMPSVISGY